MPTICLYKFVSPVCLADKEGASFDRSTFGVFPNLVLCTGLSFSNRGLQAIIFPLPEDNIPGPSFKLFSHMPASFEPVSEPKCINPEIESDYYTVIVINY